MYGAYPSANPLSQPKASQFHSLPWRIRFLAPSRTNSKRSIVPELWPAPTKALLQSYLSSEDCQPREQGEGDASPWKGIQGAPTRRHEHARSKFPSTLLRCLMRSVCGRTARAANRRENDQVVSSSSTVSSEITGRATRATNADDDSSGWRIASSVKYSGDRSPRHHVHCQW